MANRQLKNHGPFGKNGCQNELGLNWKGGRPGPCKLEKLGNQIICTESPISDDDDLGIVKCFFDLCDAVGFKLCYNCSII